MSKKKFMIAMGKIDDSIIDRYIKIEENLVQRKKGRKNFRVTLVAAVACFCMILSAVLVVPGVLGDKTTSPHTNKPQEPTIVPPKISYLANGEKITGVQGISIGDKSPSSKSSADMLPPGFDIKTVFEAKVIEVLPDVYHCPTYNLHFRIAKLEIIDEIRGSGLPKEIFYRYPIYGADLFDGYDSFIFSVEQIGVQNYLMINQTQGKVEYFSDMFQSTYAYDPGYGSVIAFNDGVIDESFWIDNNFIYLLDEDFFPASRGSTVEEVKNNIISLTGDENFWRIYHPDDYITSDDIFVSEAALAIKEYLNPDSENVFMQKIYTWDNRVVATYTRLINGFITDEVITINGYDGEIGEVRRYADGYTSDDLTRVPDIGDAMSRLNLSEIDPPHIDITDYHSLINCQALGWYRKVDGKIYAIIRIWWNYDYSVNNHHRGYMQDDFYILYDSDCNGSIVERDELRAIIGDDNRILKFPYNLLCNIAI